MIKIFKNFKFLRIYSLICSVGIFIGSLIDLYLFLKNPTIINLYLFLFILGCISIYTCLEYATKSYVIQNDVLIFRTVVKKDVAYNIADISEMKIISGYLPYLKVTLKGNKKLYCIVRDPAALKKCLEKIKNAAE